jgi:pimeloyl-ACP methyl ester carboxylesterase/predicted alpha/beta superfamily hydrolase
MKNKILKAFFALMLLMVLIMSQSFIQAQEDGDDIAIGKYRVFHSDIMDEDRLLFVHLPRDYEDTRLSYPVLYLLYADIYNYYLDAASITEKLGVTGEIPPVIIVGVANTNRYRDLLPVKIRGRNDSGGANKFLRFIQEELIPYVDDNYRTKNFKILAGPQAAAVFSLYALISNPALFNAILSENPFMNPENAKFLFPEAELFFKKTESLKNFLYIKCEKNERPKDLEYVENFAKLIESNRPKGFHFKMEIREPSGYFIAPLPFREGLRALFAGHKLPESFQTNTVNDIISYYEKLLDEYGFEVDPPSLMLTFEGDKLNQQRKTQQALEIFEYQLSLYPRSLNALWQLGESYRGMGEFERAREYYRKFLDIRDTDVAMIQQRLSQVERIIKESVAYRIEQAINKSGIDAGLKKYRDIKSDAENKLYFDENEFNALGYRLMGTEKISEAIEIFKLNVELHPESANVYDSLGEAYMNSGDVKNAINSYKKALELNPDNNNAKEMLKKLEKKLEVPSAHGTSAMSNQEIEAVETLVQVGKYHLNFKVIEGWDLTILLEAGGGMNSGEWNNLAPELARKTGATIVSYDRAGFGKSDLPETPHDMSEEVEWLWQGLQKLDLNKNLVLVGHSFGGWMIRLFESEHPDVVQGMVFVDPFTNEFVDLLGVEYLDNHPMAGKLPFDTSQPDKLSKIQRAMIRMVGDGLGPKMEIMSKTKLPSDIPVVVITSGRQFLPKTEEQEAWRKSHEQLSASVKGAILIVAEESDHMIPFRQPDLIIDAVMKVIDNEKKHFPHLEGKYFGQKVPGIKAELFAPGLISLEGRYEFAPSFSPEGDKLLFTAGVPEKSVCVFYTRIVDGGWTKPKPVSLSKGAKKEEMEAFFSWDGRHIFFAPYDEGLDVRIWKVDIHEDGWHNPQPLAGQISDESSFFPTSSKKGALYYSNIAQRKIYKALLEKGVVQESGEAGLEFGGHGFIAPDESFIIVDSIQDDGHGKQDIFVAFRNEDGDWSKPVNLGNEVNTEYFETCPTLSSDGKYLFFSRYNEPGEISNIYWVDAKIIEDLKPKNLK